jgi:hypothetical protein
MRLGDIAQIQRGYVDPASSKCAFRGKQVVAVGVSMVKGGDIIAPRPSVARFKTMKHPIQLAPWHQLGAVPGPTPSGQSLGG